MSEELDFRRATGLEILRYLKANRNGQQFFTDLLGIEFEALDEGYVVLSMAPSPDFANTHGTMHNGVVSTLLDHVMNLTVHSALPAGVTHATLEMKVNFDRPVPTAGGLLIATGNIIHMGTRSASAEGRITNQDGKLVAHASTTCVLTLNRPGRF